jgi:pimeloyl-ACP methyl ester carboxylesterase
MHGKAAAIIGHSFGGLASIYALKRQQVAEKAVIVGAPAMFDALIETFARTLLINSRIRGGIERLCENYFPDIGAAVWEKLSSFSDATKLDLPILLLHDTDDRAVASFESELLARMLPNAMLRISHGLGHNRILREKEVLNDIIAFVNGEGGNTKALNGV